MAFKRGNRHPAQTSNLRQSTLQLSNQSSMHGQHPKPAFNLPILNHAGMAGAIQQPAQSAQTGNPMQMLGNVMEHAHSGAAHIIPQSTSQYPPQSSAASLGRPVFDERDSPKDVHGNSKADFVRGGVQLATQDYVRLNTVSNSAILPSESPQRSCGYPASFQQNSPQHAILGQSASTPLSQSRAHAASHSRDTVPQLFISNVSPTAAFVSQPILASMAAVKPFNLKADLQLLLQAGPHSLSLAQSFALFTEQLRAKLVGEGDLDAAKAMTAARIGSLDTSMRMEIQAAMTYRLLLDHHMSAPTPEDTAQDRANHHLLLLLAQCYEAPGGNVAGNVAKVLARLHENIRMPNSANAEQLADWTGMLAADAYRARMLKTVT